MSVLKYYNTQTGTWLPAALGDIGPTGPTGAPGNDSMIPGPTGDVGPIGPTGNDGAVGPTGPQGEFGATGPQGEIGPTGNDGAPGMTGPQGEVGPTGVPGTDALWNFLGEYSDTPMYAEGDIVTYNGETYRRNNVDNNVTGYHPTVTQYWDKIAERGADGAEGPTGPQGEVGPTGNEGAPGMTGPQGEMGPTGDTGATGPQGDPGPGADQDLNTTNSVQFFRLTLANGDNSDMFTANNYQIKLGYDNGTFPHFIHTRHNGNDYVDNAIDFYTNDTTSAGEFPANARHGLTINNGWVGVNGNTSPQYALDVNGNAGAAANRFFVKDDGKITFVSSGTVITEELPSGGFGENNIPTSVLTGSGEPGTTISVQWDYGDTVYTINGVNDSAAGFNLGDQLKVTGDLLGGVTPDNDLIVEVIATYFDIYPGSVYDVGYVSGNPPVYPMGLHVRDASGHDWTFGQDGTMYLNGALKFGDGTTQYTAATGGGGSSPTDRITTGTYGYGVVVGEDGVVTMTTARGGLEFGALPEPGGPTHFHIMRPTGQSADLFFGDDFNYVLQRATAYGQYPAYGVEIGANDNNGGAQQVWRFGTDGTLQLPTTSTINFTHGYVGQNGFSNPLVVSAGDNLEIKTNENGNTWNFGTDGILTAPGHIVPNADLAYDLGSTSSQWRSIYVGTGTIYIGGVALGVNENNFVTVDGNPIITVNTAGNITVQGDVAIGTVIISDTAPEPSSGVQWFNTVEARTYVAYNEQWVDASPTILAPPDVNPTLESVTFNDNTTQTTAWSGTVSYNDLTDKPVTPAFVGGGGASTWLTAD